jgi:hypothetical protein
VGAEKGDDEDLVFQAEPGQFRGSEFALDGNLLFRDTDALDDNRSALGNAQKLLPIGGGFEG